MKILVTGGAGYIGSHTVVELLNANNEVIIIDDFSNSKPEVLDSIRKITKKDFSFYQGNVEDKDLLNQIFSEHHIDAVIHFAGFKAVGESVLHPLKYYHNNLFSTISLLEVMAEQECFHFVFSSSATVYGDPKSLPILEDFPLSTNSPYGTTKLMIEKILTDLSASEPRFSIQLLRYFNPIGAHESGLIGDDPNGIPNNLMPYIVKVANQELEFLHVFGNDYDTPDGTGVRDYIHVVDLAKGHLKALNYSFQTNGIVAFNLGTGIGYSVLDIVENFEKVNNVSIPYQIDPRRPGDIPSCYADPHKAFEKLNWKTEKNLEDMCRDAYRYVLNKKND